MKVKKEEGRGQSEVEVQASISLHRLTAPLRPTESETERHFRQKLIGKKREITNMVNKLKVGESNWQRRRPKQTKQSRFSFVLGPVKGSRRIIDGSWEEFQKGKSSSVNLGKFRENSQENASGFKCESKKKSSAVCLKKLVKKHFYE